MDADKPKFKLIDGGLKDHVEFDLPQETLAEIEAMLREVVPKFARYAWFIDASGWAYVFEGSPPSDRTYVMRCVGWTLCQAGETVQGIGIYPTPSLAPFEIRLHVQTLGPGKPQAVLLCQPHDDTDVPEMERTLAAIRPRLESIVAGGIWIVPEKTSEEFGLNARRPPRA